MPIKKNLNDMQKLASNFNGKCLSSQYFGMQTPLLWECEKGHRWEARPVNVKNRYWCLECKGLRRFNIQDFQKYAISKGGKCITSKYIGVKTRLEFECENGHRWQTNSAMLRRKSWCPECSKLGEYLTLKKMQKIALDRKGKCLTAHDLINFQTLIEWECELGHRWESTAISVTLGWWCPECREEMHDIIPTYEQMVHKSISQMQILAAPHKGKCLSKIYISGSSPLLWECELGHQWESNPRNIARGHWCPVCAGKIPKFIEDMQKLADSQNGKCLSLEYSKMEDPLEWECEYGHTWFTTPHLVQSGAWCPVCAGTLKLTIEQIQKLALNNGGICLSTEYINSKEDLIWKCAEGHQWSAPASRIKSGYWCPQCSHDRKKIGLIYFQQYAINNGGKCLSQKYVGIRNKLEFICSHQHKFSQTGEKIRMGNWCPKCRQIEKLKKKHFQLQKKIEKKGGMLITKLYRGSDCDIEVECKNGHRWQTKPYMINKGYWCSICKKS